MDLLHQPLILVATCMPVDDDTQVTLCANQNAGGIKSLDLS